jgi:hypothetical protein
MKTFLTISLIMLACCAFAQTDSGSVAVKKDPRVDMLIRKQIEINEVNTRDLRSSAQGFRLQVISTNNREKALEAKTKLYQQFPELKAYLLYQSPNYRLRVGNFKDRSEAEAYLDSIRSIFPGVYVVPDKIEVNPVQTPPQQ